MTDEGKMSFIDHLEELRKRLIKGVLAVFVGMIVCWFFREQILAFLLAPLYEAWGQVDGLPEPKPLNFSSMLEPFIAYLKMSAVGGLFVGAPVVLYQIWKFIAPGLYPRERKLAMPFVFVSTLLFVGGSIMAYSVVFPIGFRFFLDFAAGREMMSIEAEAIVAGPEEQIEPSKIVSSLPQVPEEARLDAGIDAGKPDGGNAEAAKEIQRAPVETASKPDSAPKIKTAPPKEEESESWYEWLLGRLVKKDCAAFRSDSNKDSPGVVLTFTWHAARCGEPPPLDKTIRDEEKLAVDWKKSPDSRPGYIVMTAADTNAGQGRHKYSVSIPATPGMGQLAPVLMVKDYLSFAIRLLLAFGLIFELPILISFLSIAGIVNYRQLLRFSRWFLIISVILGAMLTPPDVITQLLLATPLMVLYFLSIGVAYLFGPKPD
ncbi:MAG: preprotein translocase subunit TatC [Deltaproteobacteria bacterium]|nr:preprotein translocase subunit TatC [Deltaproteobacteria bacterium]